MVPIAAPQVAPALTAAVRAPACVAPVAESYDPATLEAERKCLEVAERVARRRHGALASAVIVREKAVAEAVKTSR